MKNTFKNNTEPQKRFTPTDKALMAKITGRDCTEYHERNPPVFEDSTISLSKKGLFWLGAIVTI